MQIPVNKNIDEYKDDFYKGLTLKQTFISVLTVAVGTGAFLFFFGVCHIPQEAAIYLALPVAFPVAASGFLKIYGMSPVMYFRLKHRTKQRPLFLFRPVMLQEEDDMEIAKTKQRTTTSGGQVYLETEQELYERGYV